MMLPWSHEQQPSLRASVKLLSARFPQWREAVFEKDDSLEVSIKSRSHNRFLGFADSRGDEHGSIARKLHVVAHLLVDSFLGVDAAAAPHSNLNRVPQQELVAHRGNIPFSHGDVVLDGEETGVVLFNPQSPWVVVYVIHHALKLAFPREDDIVEARLPQFGVKLFKCKVVALFFKPCYYLSKMNFYLLGDEKYAVDVVGHDLER